MKGQISRRLLGIDLSRALVNSVGASWLISPPLRVRILRWYGIDIAANVTVYPGCTFGGSAIEIGAGSFVNVGVVLDNSAPIRIGRNVLVGMEAMFVTSSHDAGPSEHRALGGSSKPIVVGDGCWIGTRSVLLPGVTVGQGCVIGAGAVVIGDLEPDGVYVGVPARRVRDLLAQGG